MSAPQNAIYGVDLRLTEDGDILVNANGDLGRVSGIDNLRQAVRSVLRCPHGWLVFDEPEYGSKLYKYQGKPNTPQTRYAAARDIQETLMADPRIAKVNKISTRQVAEDRFDIEASIVPAGQTGDLNIVYPVQL